MRANISGIRNVPSTAHKYICCMAIYFPAVRASRIAVSAFFFVAGLCFASWASRIPDIQHHLKLNNAGLGSVLFAMPVGSLLGLPLSGILVTKFGSRICALMGCIVYLALLCVLGAVSQVWQLVVDLFFFGMAGNLVNISINTQGVGVEALYKRSIMASFHGLWSLAGFAGAAIGSYMIAKNIFPLNHFLIVAGMLLLLALGAFRFTLHTDAGKHTQQKLFAWPDKSLITLGILAFLLYGM